MIGPYRAWLGLVADDRGVTSLEYAIIGGAIIATILVGFNVLAGDIASQFSQVAASFR